MIIEYDGSHFCGWQEQAHATSVQEELHQTLEVVLREKIKVVHASGRTDAGVHARAQVVNFHVSQTPDLHRLGHAVSSILRGKVSVLSTEIVDDSFHSRRSAKRKQYSYRIINRPMPLVLDQGRGWYVPDRLDIQLMKEQAALLVGEHDFTSFRAANCDAPSSVKLIYESEITESGNSLIYRVVGAGFLKQMVRTIVGTLVGIGRGTLEPKSVLEILALKDRTKAGITAPAWGLYLDWVEYPPSLTKSSAG